MNDSHHVIIPVADGTEMPTYAAFPHNTGPVPGILLWQEAFGVNAHIRAVADRLAAAGYAVVAPELFHRAAAPGLEIAYNDFPSATPHFQGITVDGLTADAQAAHAWLTAQPLVQVDKIGSIGFCLGGRVSCRFWPMPCCRWRRPCRTTAAAPTCSKTAPRTCTPRTCFSGVGSTSTSARSTSPK